MRYKTIFELEDNFISKVLKSKNSIAYMPFIYSTAHMNALIRWHELSNLSENDIYDLINFPCAMGYSNYYFTEQKYTNRIKQKPLELDKKTNCIVESNKDDYKSFK